MATINAAHPLTASPPAPSLPEAESPAVHLQVLLRFSTAMTVLLAVASFPRASFFRVTEVVVTGHRDVAAAAVVAYARIRPGDALFAVSSADVADRVARHPRVAAARVTVRSTGQVLIAVSERRAVAAVATLDTFLIVDSSGLVIDSRPDPSALPVLRVVGLSPPWVKLGDELPAPQVRQALKVLGLLPQSIQRAGVEIRMDLAEEFTIVTAGGVHVLLGPLRGLGDRAAILPEILSAIRQHKIAPRHIDLRFNGNVVLKPGAATEGAGVGR